MKRPADLAGMGVQRHSDGWRARLRLGAGRANGSVRFAQEWANEDFARLKAAKEQSVGAAQVLLQKMAQDNGACYKAVKARPAVQEWIRRGKNC